jgi:hypothetical protein
MNNLIEIVEGYTNNVKEYRVYISQKCIKQFETLEQATEFKLKYEQMLREKASIASDELD